MDGQIGPVTGPRPSLERGLGALRADALLASKLFVPPVAPTLLDRPHLLARLAEGLRRPLTLIAAPPGWGKTTLLSAWATAAPGVTPAWVSLDARDNDPARFWSYVILALRQARPVIGEMSLALLQSQQQPTPIEAVLILLLNELATVSTDAALVLDDYHLIDTAPIHHGLTFFIEHLPPRLHLFLATRADPPLPLARWRARGALLELRADDLRFTHEEADRFLTELLRLPLTQDMVAALEARTEGWIAGLQLAALAMRDRRELASFIEAFSGSHRFVADYLAEEVFLHQSAAVQAFLLRTSVLDRMCAALCQALADDSSERGDAQRQLEQLDRANLFLIPLDGERRWYRYHHLFADLLRARLQQEHPELIRVLHRRASEWFERAGLREEAIQHALDADDLARAADLLELIADPLWTGGQMATLRGWLAQLPPDVLRAHPRLLIAQAGALFYFDSRQIGAIEATLREAEAALNSAPQMRSKTEVGRLSGRIRAVQASQASWQPDTQRTIVLAREALEQLGSEDRVWRLLALTALGMAHALRGAPVAAIGPLVEATQLASAAGAYVALGPRLWLGIVHVVHGKLRDASAWFDQGLALVSQQGADNLTAANFLVGLGVWVEYEWNELETAERHLVEGIRLAGRQQWPWVLVDAYAKLARIKHLRGERDAARDLLQRMDQHAREVEIPWPWMAPRQAASMAQAWLAFGQVDRAAEWASRMDVRGRSDLAYSVEVQRITAARLLVAQGQPAPALAELDRLAPEAESHGRWGRLIEIQALRALALDGLHQQEDALAALGHALVLAEPEGYVRRFVDEGPLMKGLLWHALQRGIVPTYVAMLLRAFGDVSEPMTVGGSLTESLSDREREVLRLLVAGRSGPQIAEALVVAPSTVKTHLKSIYGKLDVHGRDQAIALARELKLL